MTKRIITPLALFFSIAAYSQDNQLNRLFHQAFHHRVSIDSGVFYATEAFQLSGEMRYSTGEEISKMYAGLAYYNGNQVDTAATCPNGEVQAQEKIGP